MTLLSRDPHESRRAPGRPRRDERVVYLRRAYTRGQLKRPTTEASLRAVPLQTRALDALDRRPDNGSPLVFAGERGGYLDIHHFRPLPMAPGAAGRGHQPAAADLAHLRNVRAPCRHLNLRPLPLYRRKPDHDRRPLRPPRATVASMRSGCLTPSMRPSSTRGRWWTLGDVERRERVKSGNRNRSTRPDACSAARSTATSATPSPRRSAATPSPPSPERENHRF